MDFYKIYRLNVLAAGGPLLSKGTGTANEEEAPPEEIVCNCTTRPTIGDYYTINGTFNESIAGEGFSARYRCDSTLYTGANSNFQLIPATATEAGSPSSS